jgi:uncharacterized protein
MFRWYFVFFILIAALVYFGMHYYVYIQIVKGLSLVSPARVWLMVFFLVSAFSFFVGEILNRRQTVFAVKLVAYYGSVWMGIIAIALSVFLIRNLFLVLFHGDAFRYYSVVAALAVFALASGYSLYNGLRAPVLREVDVKIGKLPKTMEGFTIVQLSDLHLDNLKSAAWFENIVDRANALNPDLIVITGDLVDVDLCKMDCYCDILAKLKAKYGVYAITGNHEFYVGIDKFIAILKKTNIPLLRQGKVTIAGALELAGIDDISGNNSAQADAWLKTALENCDFKKPVILLSHQPGIFDKAAASGVDLQLSGHTHAGQIPPMDLIVMFYFKYPWGLHRKNSSYLYTTVGTGTWGPPMRLFSRSELVKIVLK